MMDSASTDPELRQWLRWTFESGKVPMFVRTVAEAALVACSLDSISIRRVLSPYRRWSSRGSFFRGPGFVPFTSSFRGGFGSSKI